MSDRVSVIDAAVGELQSTVERQQEEIDRLTEMMEMWNRFVADLHGKFEKDEVDQ